MGDGETTDLGRILDSLDYAKKKKKSEPRQRLARRGGVGRAQENKRLCKRKVRETAKARAGVPDKGSVDNS